MNDKQPKIRRDLEFFPIQHGNQQLILIRDHLGLVREGQGVAPDLYQFMTLLDGTKSLRDLQMALMRQKGGILVGSDEVAQLLNKLDEGFLLDSDRFQAARTEIEVGFTSSNIRPCSHSGRSYPQDPAALRKRLNEIMTDPASTAEPQGKISALLCPHIDISVGYRVYASAYRMLKYTAPARVIILGIGHRLLNDLFSLTDKDFKTPLGVVKNDPSLIKVLRDAGGDILAATDLDHRSEHSLEFQLIFLQHLLAEQSFTILPILCGSLQTNLPRYTRSDFLQKAGLFLRKLKEIIHQSNKETLVVAGVDFSHIGPKFGHARPAGYSESRTRNHDHNLLESLARWEADRFWEESIKVGDQFNVCGFPAMACLFEILPESSGTILDYQMSLEQATQSAVSFAAAVFTSKD
jgi:AmmeMemoRadiSam system protein B